MHAVRGLALCCGLYRFAKRETERGEPRGEICAGPVDSFRGSDAGRLTYRDTHTHPAVDGGPRGFISSGRRLIVTGRRIKLEHCYCNITNLKIITIYKFSCNHLINLNIYILLMYFDYLSLVDYLFNLLLLKLPSYFYCTSCCF